MTNNRARGRHAENEFAALIGGKRVSEAGLPGPDVEGPDGTLYEVKRIKKLPVLLLKWLGQMKKEGAQKVAFRADHDKWIIMHYYE